MNKKIKNYNISILCPGGNDQLLIEEIVTHEKRKEINDRVIKVYPNVEQVSFYQYDTIRNLARLDLAGGEFCGNATRSLAYLLLKGKKGSIKINVSGTKQTLNAGVKKENTAFAQMPIYSSMERIKKLDKNLFRVDLEGIVHLIYLKNNNFILNKSDLKKLAEELLKKQNLLFTEPAAGVMYIKEKGEQIIMEPVVWVRDITTLLYESACASGSTAIGLLKAKENKNYQTNLTVRQPSGENISVKIIKNKNVFIEAEIDGPIKILKQTQIKL